MHIYGQSLPIGMKGRNIMSQHKGLGRKLVLEAEKRNDKLKGELKRLSEMDEIIARLYGIDEDLVING